MNNGQNPPRIENLGDGGLLNGMKIKAFILDMDGVLWRGSEPIVDLPATFARIDALGSKVVLATNNATRSVDQYLVKLKSLGVDLDPWQVVNTALATSLYLKGRFPQGGPVFLIGESGLELTLKEHGFYHGENEALAVIASLDREFTYEKLSRASTLVRSGVPLIGTNPDLTFPSPKGQLPGAGSILAALEAASDTRPTIIGKPQPAMFQIALKRLGTQPGKTLVVGDRLETDIAGGQAAQCRTALVLSGVTSPEKAAAWSPAPDLIAEDLSGVLDQVMSHGRA